MAKQWLSERNAKLIISDDAGFFYKITYVELDDNERTSERIGNFYSDISHTGWAPIFRRWCNGI